MIVMCNYCTVPNLDGVAPQTMPVDGADGIVFITRDGLSGAAWTQLKRRVIRAIRAFRARRPTHLGGGGGDKDVADVRVHVGDDMILVEVEPGQVDDLKDSLSAELTDSDVIQARDGVMPAFVEAVEEFVEDRDKAKAPDESLSVLTANVLKEMRTADLSEAKEFAKEETRAVLEDVSKQVQSEVPKTLEAIQSSAAVFAATAAQFDMGKDEAVQVFRLQVDEVSSQYARVDDFVQSVHDQIHGARTFEEVKKQVDDLLQSAQASEDADAQLPDLKVRIRDGIAKANSSCPPCTTVDLHMKERNGQRSGVRTQEPDEGTDACMLRPHPLLAPIEWATQIAAKAKNEWSKAAIVAAFLDGNHVPQGQLTKILLERLSDFVDAAEKNTSPQLATIAQYVHDVTDILTRNRVHDLPPRSLVDLVTKGDEGCSPMRASAVMCSDRIVRLVVMDGDFDEGQPANNLRDVWAAAHEKQASLARYRRAHALFRAAQLRGDKKDADDIHDKIIQLQVDEIVADMATVKKGIEDNATVKPEDAEHSIEWIEATGYAECLVWLNELLTQSKEKARQALRDRVVQIADLKHEAEDEYDVAKTAAKDTTSTECPDVHVATMETHVDKLTKALNRLSQMPDVGAAAGDVLDELHQLKATSADVQLALEATGKHVEWLRRTFCGSFTGVDHGLALPFLAAAAERSRTHIEKTATDALRKYADANAAFDEATKYLVLCTCAFDDTTQRENVALVLTDSNPFAVAVHVDSTKKDVTLLLQYLSSDAATHLRPLMNHVDIATCAHLAALKPQLDEEQRFPRLVAVAAILQPELHNSDDASLDKFLSTSKYGLDCGDAIAAPNLTGTGTAVVHRKVVQLFAEAVKSDFKIYCKPRQSQWNSYCESLSHTRDAFEIIVTDHRKGEPLPNVFASNACIGLLVDALDRTTKVTLPEGSPDNLDSDVFNAIKHGIPLRALASWVESSLAKQKAALTDMVRQEPQGSLLATTIHNVLKRAVEYTHPNINAVRFLLNVRDKTKDVCRIVYDKDQVLATVKAQADKNKDLAKRINELLVLGDSVPDTIAKQTWREFWIAPVEAYDEWTKKPPVDAQVPAFFQHVFPDMSKYDIQQQKYTDLTNALKGAPPSMYMYAFTQARKWLATKQGTTFGGGARRRAHVPHPHFRVEPAAYASASARPEVSPALRSHDSITPAPLEAGGSGPATRSHNRTSAQPHSLRSKPKSSLAGAVRRAVTLLVMEHKRISAAECCNRLLAGKFARGTRREDTAVISAESDRAALCRLAKELCGPLCR